MEHVNQKHVAIAIFLCGLDAGAMTWRMHDMGRFHDAWIVFGMLACVLFFYGEDVHIDDTFRRDAWKAKREAAWM